MYERVLFDENKVLRHSLANRLVHWTVAVSTFILIFSGFGQMPIYKRYLVSSIPGLAWTADYSVTLTMHYLAAIPLLLAAFYHVAYNLIRKDFDLIPKAGDGRESAKIIKAILFKGQEPASDKYLAEQRLSYALTAGSLGLIIITGLIKVVKNLPGIDFSEGIMIWVTNLHNLGSILLILSIAAHLGAFVFKINRFMLPGLLTGKVDLSYVKHRHSIWYSRLLGENTTHQNPPSAEKICDKKDLTLT